MSIGGYHEGDISRAQATKKMKAAGFKYGTKAWWEEWNRCYQRLEGGRYMEVREPVSSPVRPQYRPLFSGERHDVV